MVVLMNIEEIERNNAVLRKTIKYVNGEIKEVVEKQIVHNLNRIDRFFDELEQEYRHIQSYEQGGPDGN
tara:strand:+ start:522 stop:728 length:207 start_codon:yes stop_codon:yes gene_type:complete